jgi:murein DD-endopeptidase MepM/ murein hydrolase activator NlpD
VLEGLAAWVTTQAANAARAKAMQLGVRGGRKALAVIVPLFIVLALVTTIGLTGRASTAATAANSVVLGSGAGTTACTPNGSSSAALANGSGDAARYDAAYVAAAATYPGSLSAPLLKAQAWAESGFRANAGSPAGAYGWMQFMPGTWAAHGVDGDKDGRADISNPVDAIFSAAKYGAQLRTSVQAYVSATATSDMLVLAAYNAGPGNVAKYAGIPPFAETRTYVTKIPAKAAEFALGGASAVDGSTGAGYETCTAQASTSVVGGYTNPLTKGTYRISSGFGPRNTGIAGASHIHAGTDLAAPIGTPIHAVAAGTVTRAGAASGYGQAVYIRHSDGVVTRYGHVSAIYVQAGQAVTAGQKIAAVGNEGVSSGPHLHLECRPNDVPTDCVPWLAARGVVL